jgi:nucleoside-diphosphate-sugar epimerase
MIAIIGAGWLGAAIANACTGPVIATTRSGRRPDALATAIDIATLDLLADPIDLAPIAHAEAWLFAIAPGRDQDRRALYVDGPTRLLARLRETRVRRVVWIGSTSALPDTNGIVDETHQTWPTEPRGIVQREAERAVQQHCDAEDVAWMVLRMGGLYGPGRELGRIFGGNPGDGDRATNLVHRDDAVTAAIAALASSRAGIVHVVDDDHCARRVMIDAARASAGLAPAEWAGAPAPPPHGKQVANARLRDWLGVRLQHPRHSPLATPDRGA